MTFNVKDFGATGNGVSDDAVPIQRCLDTARGCDVYAPAGTYVINQPLRHVADSPKSPGIRLRGDGAGLTVFNNRVVGKAMLAVDQAAPMKFCYNGFLRDFSITSSLKSIDGHGIQVKAAYRLLISDLDIDGMGGDGIRFQADKGDEDGFSGCHVERCHIIRSGGWGINMAGANIGGMMRVSDSTLTDNLKGGMHLKSLGAVLSMVVFSANPGGGLKVDYDDVNHSHNITLDTCYFESNAGWNIDINAFIQFRAINTQFTHYHPPLKGVGLVRVGSEVLGATSLAESALFQGTTFRVVPQIKPFVGFAAMPNAKGSRVERTSWKVFGAPGQTRTSGDIEVIP